MSGLKLLPPAPGRCSICATEHEPNFPHNAQSLYYQYWFYGLRGRWPTWADAVAHCDETTQSLWRSVLRKHGAWTEPEGDPIADAPAESAHQVVEIETAED